MCCVSCIYATFSSYMYVILQHFVIGRWILHAYLLNRSTQWQYTDIFSRVATYSPKNIQFDVLGPCFLHRFTVAKSLKQTSACFGMEEEGTCWYTNFVRTRFYCRTPMAAPTMHILIALQWFNEFFTRPAAQEVGAYRSGHRQKGLLAVWLIHPPSPQERRFFFPADTAAMLTPIVTLLYVNSSEAAICSFAVLSFKIKSVGHIYVFIISLC